MYLNGLPQGEDRKALNFFVKKNGVDTDYMLKVCPEKWLKEEVEDKEKHYYQPIILDDIEKGLQIVSKILELPLDQFMTFAGHGYSQYIEAQTINSLLKELTELGIPSITIHDSIIVKKSDIAKFEESHKKADFYKIMLKTRYKEAKKFIKQVVKNKGYENSIIEKEKEQYLKFLPHIKIENVNKLAKTLLNDLKDFEAKNKEKAPYTLWGSHIYLNRMLFKALVDKHNRILPIDIKNLIKSYFKCKKRTIAKRILGKIVKNIKEYNIKIRIHNEKLIGSMQLKGIKKELKIKSIILLMKKYRTSFPIKRYKNQLSLKQKIQYFNIKYAESNKINIKERKKQKNKNKQIKSLLTIKEKIIKLNSKKSKQKIKQKLKIIKSRAEGHGIKYRVVIVSAIRSSKVVNGRKLTGREPVLKVLALDICESAESC